MQILTFLPKSIVGEDFDRSTTLLKRQLAIMLKVSEQDFKGYAVEICGTLNSIFYFSPHDDKDLHELTVKVAARLISTGIELDFGCFLDAVAFLPSGMLTGVKVKCVPKSFTMDFVHQYPDFTAAWDLLHPENKLPAAAATSKKTCAVDETFALLNDKSFVHEHKQFILDTQYEDEFVDNEDFPEDANGGSTPFSTFTDTDIALLSAYIRTPELYDKEARKTEARSKLCVKTKMAHEQVEGWAVMMRRNPGREAILRRFTTWEIGQNRL